MAIKNKKYISVSFNLYNLLILDSKQIIFAHILYLISSIIIFSAPVYANTPPTHINPPTLKYNEDYHQQQIDLKPFFNDNEQPSSSLNYSIVNSTKPTLFSNINITSGVLNLSFAKNQNGISDITIKALDNGGLSTTGIIKVIIVPVNDLPFCSAFNNIDLSGNTTTKTINLHTHCGDLEDSDNLLKFDITSSNNSLVQLSSVDPNTGIFTITKKTGALGNVKITVKVTDSDGGWIERTMGPNEFKVYSAFLGDPSMYPSLTGMGLSNITLLTNWYYLKLLPGSTTQYYEDSIDETQWRDTLKNKVPRDGRPLPMNVEIDQYFGNDGPGRNRLARLMEIAHEVRPDINTIGFYRLLPERNWHTPVYYARQQQSKLLGLSDYFLIEPQLSSMPAEFSAWQARNAFYRNQAVSTSQGGFVADKVNIVYPSLYTFYRNNQYSTKYTEVKFEHLSDTLHSKSTPFTDGTIFQFVRLKEGSLPKNLKMWTDYEIVNSAFESNGSRFRVKEVATAQIIDFTDNGTGRGVISSKGPWQNLWEDGGVVDWDLYADENIKEARKYNKPILPFISPSFNGDGLSINRKDIEKEFFRHQLDVMYNLKVNGVVIYEEGQKGASFYLNSPWWSAISEFTNDLKAPLTTFNVFLGDSIKPSAPSNIRAH